jgi:hypothetical protein
LHRAFGDPVVGRVHAGGYDHALDQGSRGTAIGLLLTTMTFTPWRSATR